MMTTKELILVLFALCGVAIADELGLSNLESHMTECKSAAGVCFLGEVCTPSKFHNSSASLGKLYLPLKQEKKNIISL